VDESIAGREKLVAELRTPKGWQRLFGDPLALGGSSYALCIYSPAALAGEIRVDRAGALCAGKPCWRAKRGSRTRYTYLDPERAADGTRTLKITHAAAEDRIKWRAENRARAGQNALPTGIVVALPAPAGGSPLLQLHASDATPCRSVALRTQSAKAGRYRGVAP
jgi:hypothetical protein